MLRQAPEQAVAKVVFPQLFNWNFFSVGESLSVPLSNSTPPTCPKRQTLFPSHQRKAKTSAAGTHLAPCFGCSTDLRETLEF